MELNYCRLGDLGACFLAQALKTNVSLREIHLICAGIGPIGHIALAEAALQNTTLDILCLRENGCVLSAFVVRSRALEIDVYLGAKACTISIKEHLPGVRLQIVTLYRLCCSHMHASHSRNAHTHTA